MMDSINRLIILFIKRRRKKMVNEMVLNKAFQCASPVVLEAAMELLAHLTPDKKAQEEYLKKQFQKVPKNLNLENYLMQRRKNDYL